MAAGKRDLKPAPGLRLAADFGQVRVRRSGGPGLCAFSYFIGHPAGCIHQLDARWSYRRRATAAVGPDHLYRLAECADPRNLHPVDETRLVKGGGCDDDPPESASSEGRDHRQHAGHRSNLPTQRQLADQRDLVRSGSDLFGAEQDADRHREVE